MEDDMTSDVAIFQWYRLTAGVVEAQGRLLLLFDLLSLVPMWLRAGKGVFARQKLLSELIHAVICDLRELPAGLGMILTSYRLRWGVKIEENLIAERCDVT